MTSVTWNAKNCSDFESDEDTPFKDLLGINTFRFGKDVQKIPANLCNGLIGLKTITIGREVKKIHVPAPLCELYRGLKYYPFLRENSVTLIGDYAFKDCKALLTVTNNALTPQPINETVFSGVDVCQIALLVPEDSYDLYNHVAHWKDFLVKINGVEGAEVDKDKKEI